MLKPLILKVTTNFAVLLLAAATAAAQDRPAPPIEIVLPDGPIVRVAAGFDPSTLGHVLAVLEGRPC